MISTKSYNNPDCDALFMDSDEWRRDGLHAVSHVIYETLATVKAAIECYGQTPLEPRPLQEACAQLRQLHGALSLLEFGQGAQLLMEADSIVRALLNGESRGVGACNLLLRAIHELQATLVPLDTHLRPLLGLDAVIGELRGFLSGQGDLFLPPAEPGCGTTDLEYEVLRAGEWHDHCGAHDHGPEQETGVYVAQIKDRLKEVVQIMPQWWEDMHNAQVLETLHQSFRIIADRAQSLNLSELADLAALLERLVARVNDDMIPMTTQMMYGVIEQGVLKLGVLFLQYCRPHDPPQGGAERARLASALADMQLLTNEVTSLASDAHPPLVPTVRREGLHQAGAQVPAAPVDTLLEGGAAFGNGSDGFEKVEDLLIEANLLHSQLLPRINMMKHQQQHIQAQLANLQYPAGNGPSPDGLYNASRDDDAIAEKVVAMMNASQLLAKLISEAEACLLKYRQATHEVQRAIFGGVSQSSRGKQPAT